MSAQRVRQLEAHIRGNSGFSIQYLERVVRDTRNLFAASETSTVPRYSRSTLPGWGGLCISMMVPMITVRVAAVVPYRHAARFFYYV